MSIQASGLTMSNEQQARRMLTAAANPAGGISLRSALFSPFSVGPKEKNATVTENLK
jgi:hypothetical protein